VKVIKTNLALFFLCFGTLLLFTSNSPAQWGPRGNPAFHSTRVEELFIWKISEELKLSVKEEKEVASLIKDLNQRKSDANEKIEALVQKQMAAEGDSTASSFVKDYRIAINNYNKISVDEIDRIQKILPKAKVAKYFVVKSDLSKRIRGLLALPEHIRGRSLERTKVDQPPMEDPKIIEE
jgi:alanyl-tRNA synthetase